MSAPSGSPQTTTTGGWVHRDSAATGLAEIPHIELWTHGSGRIGLLAIPRARLLIAPHLEPWLLRTTGEAVRAATARSAWDSAHPPGPLVAAHALPSACVLSDADYDQAHAVGFRNALTLGLDVCGARYSVTDRERALAYARGVLDALSRPLPTSPSSPPRGTSS